MTQNNLSFEKSFERLEEILDHMNEGKVPLEESLKLFEEANDLIKKCDNYLNASEKKIETLIKNRSNELALDENQAPQVKEFHTPQNQVLSQSESFGDA